MANVIPLVVADFETQLSTAIGVGDTSFSISSATDDDGQSLPAGKYCFTVNNGSSNKQYLIGQLNGTDVTSVYTVSRQGVETSGASEVARAGSPVIISDFAALQRVVDILRGQLSLDGANPLIYDTAPTLADGKELATVQYVLDTVSGGTVSFDAQIIAGTAGESVVAGNLLYFKTSDQEWYKTDADTAATVEGVQLGIAIGSGSDGVAITGGVQIAGTYTTSGLTAGSLYYVSNTAGAIATSTGTIRRVVGIALSTTKLLLSTKPVEAQSTSTDVPVGTVFPFAGSTAPTGYLLCYGQAVSRSTYSTLFTLLSTTYGSGDGSTTFNIPDLRGRVIAGLDNLGGSSANRITSVNADSLGGVYGSETHTLTEAEIPAHTHTVPKDTGGGSDSTLTGGNQAGATTASGSTGGGDPHNNVQPTFFMSYIIRAL